MALHKPNDFMMDPCFCHICYQEIRQDQHGIEHSGHGQLSQTKDPRIPKIDGYIEGYATIWLHPECATVLALRLAYDVMRIKSDKTQPMRVVDGLQALSKTHQAR
jgi:hypothetical protein